MSRMNIEEDIFSPIRHDPPLDGNLSVLQCSNLSVISEAEQALDEVSLERGLDLPIASIIDESKLQDDDIFSPIRSDVPLGDNFPLMKSFDLSNQSIEGQEQSDSVLSSALNAAAEQNKSTQKKNTFSSRTSPRLSKTEDTSATIPTLTDLHFLMKDNGDSKERKHSANNITVRERNVVMDLPSFPETKTTHKASGRRSGSHGHHTSTTQRSSENSRGNSSASKAQNGTSGKSDASNQVTNLAAVKVRDNELVHLVPCNESVVKPSAEKTKKSPRYTSSSGTKSSASRPNVLGSVKEHLITNLNKDFDLAKKANGVNFGDNKGNVTQTGAEYSTENNSSFLTGDTDPKPHEIQVGVLEKLIKNAVSLEFDNVRQLMYQQQMTLLKLHYKSMDKVEQLLKQNADLVDSIEYLREENRQLKAIFQ